MFSPFSPIGGRVRVSFFGSFRVRVRGGVRVRFWLGPGTQLDPIFFYINSEKCIEYGK